MQANSCQLALLGSTVLSSLDDIAETVTQTEWLVRDLGQTVTGAFTVVQTDLRSIESKTLVTNRALTELLAKVDTVSEQMSGLVSCLSYKESRFARDVVPNRRVVARPFKSPIHNPLCENHSETRYLGPESLPQMSVLPLEATGHFGLRCADVPSAMMTRYTDIPPGGWSSICIDGRPNSTARVANSTESTTRRTRHSKLGFQLCLGAF